MHRTFISCLKLTTAPTIPSSVSDISYCFYNNQLLTTAPTLPSSIANLACTFAKCNALTGNIYIQSENITNVYKAFDLTTAMKNVYIPFQNNGVYTRTYNTFIAAGYTTTGSKEGVYLKDLATI